MDGGSHVIFAVFNAKFQRNGYRFELTLKNHPSSKKQSVESESGCGSYRWFKINYFFRNFVMARQFQHESESLRSPDIDFKHVGRCRMIIPFPEKVYNKYSNLYWMSYDYLKLDQLGSSIFWVLNLHLNGPKHHALLWVGP